MAGLVLSVDDVQVQHIRIRVSRHDRLVGEMEVVPQFDGKHLVVGEQRWWRPEHLADEDVAGYYGAVADRLWDEVVQLAERLEATLSTVDDGAVGSAGAQRLRARGFRQYGVMWFRERPQTRLRRGGVRGNR